MAQPDLIPMPFAENATPGTIEPIEATTPTEPQDATWSAGFPQVTMQPLASGGIPPRGQNFNGVLNALSQHIFHTQGGGQYKWDDAHGPYSIGDVLQSDDGLRSYVSVVDNNTDNFNTTPSAIGDTWHPWSGGASSELVAGLIQLATSAETQTGTISTKAVTPSALSSRTSTESRTGLIQLAITAEAQALINDTNALTPKKLLDSGAVFAGEVRVFAGAEANIPEGWLPCNGAEISRTTYSRLFGVIGTTYGSGNGSTTFNIPDLRAAFVRGLDNGRGVDTGRSLGSAQGDALQNITGVVSGRTATQSGRIFSSTSSGAFSTSGTASAQYASQTTSGSDSDRFTTLEFDASRAARTANETRPRNVAMNYIIKY